MKLKSLILSAILATILSASALCGVVFYKSKMDSKRIDLSAFYNLSKNIENLNSENKENVEIKNENAQIISLIEKELTGEIRVLKKIAQANAEIRKNKNEIIVKNKIAQNKMAIAKVASKTTKEDLSRFEINNKESIKIEPISSEKIITIKFKNLEFEEVVVEDKVVSNQAATIVNEVKAEEKEETSDDIVVFDYDKKSEAKENKLYDRPISNSVKKAISREIDSLPAIKPVLEKEKANFEQKTEINLKSDKEVVSAPEEEGAEQIVYDYSVENKSAFEKASDELTTNAFVGESKHYTIRAREIDINSGKSNKSIGFDFSPDYDRNEIISDNSRGSIDLHEMLESEKNILTGTMYKAGFLATRLELNLNIHNNIEIPLIKENMFTGDENQASAIMINLSNEIKDIEIDHEYKEKKYLNTAFEYVNTRDEARYLLFGGVGAGNVLVKYQLAKGETAEKISFVGYGELLFDDPSFESKTRIVYEIEQRPLMTAKKIPLRTADENVRYAGKREYSKRKAIGAYEILLPTTTHTMRKYLEVKNDENKFFIGVDNKNKLEIPTNEYVQKVLEVAQLGSLQESCVVQVNLPRPILSMKIGGKNQKGEMYITQSSIDQEGNFNSDNFELAEKVFVVGEGEGQINARVEYSDGTSGYLKTFCREGAYLIEQL